MKNPEPAGDAAPSGPDQRVRATPIVPDRAEAERFLTALDPNATEFTFQTFDDNAERKKERKAKGKKDSFAKVFNGTLAQHWDALVKLNAKGAGIYVTLNETDFKGRTAKNIVRIRAFFVDLDGAPLGPVVDLNTPTLQPHFITETSSKRWQAFWRVIAATEADAKIMFEQFGAVQKAIAARYGGDPSVHDLPRVVRLPGFIHRKGKPFLSRAGTKKLDVTSYDWNEIRSAFPPVDDEKPPRPDPQPPRAGNDLPKRWKFLNTYALDHLDLWVPRLFPAANKSKQGYRVSSAALGRNLEEDISFTRDGIVDFGVHDMGDANQGRRTAIDIVQEWNRCDFEAAVRWLCQALGLDARDYLPGEKKTINGGGGNGGGGPAPGPGPAQTDADKLLAALNTDHCVVLDGARAVVLRFEEIEYDAGGEHYVIRAPTFLRFNDFRNFYLHRRIEVGQGRSKDWGDWWLHHSQRRQYAGVIFKPGGAQVINGKLNLWLGWGVTPKRGEWGLMREHIYEVLAARDDDVDRYLINWLAWAVQHADQQPETALVFLGERGTGKGTLAKAMCRIFGQHSLHLSSSDHLTGRFTGHLRQCSFLFADEAYAPGDKTAEGRLKRLITEPTLTIEAKGRDPVDEPNRLHIMMASNNEWVIPAGEHERRFVVQRVADTYRQDPAWFGPIYQRLRSGGYEAMLFDLLHHDMGDWHPRQIVRTAALAEQQEQSLSPLDAWWLQLLQTAVLAGANSSAPDRAISNRYEDEISESDGFGGRRTRTVKRDGLYDQARAVSPELRGYTEAALGRYLKQQGCRNAWVRRHRGWQFPPLANCRARWLERFPMTVWNDLETNEWTTGGED